MTSGNETRRLQLRLAGLGDLGPEDRGLIDRLIGGHPRALQFVDALLRQGMGAPTVLPKLRNLARQQQVDLKCERSVPDAIGEAVRLAAADIVVDELIGLLEGPETEVLLQVAVSGLPVPLDDLAGVLDRAGVCRSDEVGPAVAPIGGSHLAHRHRRRGVGAPVDRDRVARTSRPRGVFGAGSPRRTITPHVV